MLNKLLICTCFLIHTHIIAASTNQSKQDHAMGCTEHPILNISRKKALHYITATFNNPQYYTGFFVHESDISKHTGDFSLKLQSPICLKFKYKQPSVLQIIKKSNSMFYKIGDFNKQSSHYHKSPARKMHLNSIFQTIFTDNSTWLSKITITTAYLTDNILNVTFTLFKQEITLTINIKTHKLLGWYFTDPKTGRNFIKLYYHTHEIKIHNYNFD